MPPNPTSYAKCHAPNAQRRALAPALESFESNHAERNEAMAAAYLTGAYSQQEIADHFGVHYSTVSRAVKAYEHRRGR